MAGDRISQALARIDAAASRIEAAAARSSSTPGNTGDPELARKYESLRRETGAALAELDRLIGSIER